jgi:hypothetical protein
MRIQPGIQIAEMTILLVIRYETVATAMTTVAARASIGKAA